MDCGFDFGAAAVRGRASGWDLLYMKKNLAIVVLGVALVASLIYSGNLILAVGAMRASSRDVRLASMGVWSQACQHAAAGSPARVKWCVWAANQTTLSASSEGVSGEDYQALALKQYSHQKGPLYTALKNIK
jgi:hypothetical protein